ncbi:serine/arginine repetitive matrix protein 1-like [Palaemon carinicauda]|uniref:serine/arginine repetitive matrix protein 1-like n=1 Tax=Palaemon carinicauda TaxID=392227 RepID=UPI0035B580C4
MPGSTSSKGSGSRNNNNYGVVATQYYESGPPASKMQLTSLEDGDVYETVKEEEWLKRKKVTTTTTKNIETRTQRQVVLEDGEVVADSGPIVTKDCKEDTVTNEVVADEHLTPEGQEGGADEPPGEGWVPIGGAIVVSEKTEHITNSHQVAENKREMEEVMHCGDVTNKEVEDHVEGRTDLRALTEAREGRGWEVAKPERRLVHESARKWGTVDTEDVHETSRIQDGHVVTETERTTQHEEYDNESLPDSGSSLSDGSVHEKVNETQHNIVHTKDEDIVEYYAVPRGGTLAQGVKLGEGMHVVSEDFHEDREGEELDSLSERLRRARRLGALKQKPRETPERTDALTRRPLDYHEEEETRKSETNRWLENHFGSESGRSGSSHHEPEEESGVHTVGGNIIKITMSPRPATPEDQPDAAAPSSMRRWSNAPLAPSPSDECKAPPPPPPPKPTASWTPSAPISSHQPMPPGDEITDSMIAAARAKLRSTGRILDESEQSTPPISPPATNGSTRYTNLSERVHGLSKSSGGTFTSPPMSPTGVNSYQRDDPVFNSRFRSGSPCGVTSRLFPTPLKNSRPTSHSPPDSPPPLPSTPPPQSNNVGRSQSFNVQTKSWMNNVSRTPLSRPLESRMKEYKSEEQLDVVGHRSSRLWPPPRRDPSPEPPRERTPSPPPRQRSFYSSPSPTENAHYNTAPTRSSRSRRSESSTQTIARDSATQTGPSPVPPPRTKRKTKPKTYYFGEDSSSTTSSSNRLSKTPLVSTSTTTQSYSRVTQDNRTSPKIERRFKTTKTITPVVMATPSSNNQANHSSSLKNKSWHYRSMDELSSGPDNTPRASWTNTVDPRRQPRNYNLTKEPETKTLPKKLVNGTTSPSKTYIFGNESTSGRRRMGSGSSSHMRRSHGGSMVNVSLAGMSCPKSTNYQEPEEPQTPSKGIKSVVRSQSLNVKPAPLSVMGTTTPSGTGLTSNLSSQQKTSSVYRSSPYLNLRSPNLIATIARTNSTRRTEEEYNGYKHDESPPPPERYQPSYSSRNNVSRNNSTVNRSTINNTSMTNGDTEKDDEKRDRFMKGLLTTAPELFHFIHGEEGGKESNNNTERSRHSPNPPESPPQLIRPPESPVSPPSNAPRIFTFGRGENGSLKRTPSLSQENNRFSSLGRQRESITSSYLENNNNRDSITSSINQRNSLSSQYHRNAALNSNGTNSLHRPKFNLKTSGSSLLYSPSFRSQTDSTPPSRWNRRGSDSNESSSYRWRDQDDDVPIRGKNGGNVTQNLARDGAVLIPIKDWNSR